MKRAVSLLLLLVMLLCLCACNASDTQNTDPNTTTTQTTTTEAASGTTTGTHAAAETTTTAETSTTTAGLPVSTKTTVRLDLPVMTDPDLPVMTDPDLPVMTDPDLPGMTSPDAPGMTSPDAPGMTSPNAPNVTSPNQNRTSQVQTTTTTATHSTCDHTYTEQTCRVPKVCTKCQHIAGHTLPHNYKNGVCTVCGLAEFVSFNEGDWVAYVVRPGTVEQGEVLSLFIIDLDVRPTYEEDVCYLNPDACVMNVGKVVYQEKTYCVDFYPSCHLGATWEENGDTVTAVLSDTHLTLTKTGETELTVTASNDTTPVPVGTVFTKM